LLEGFSNRFEMRLVECKNVLEAVVDGAKGSKTADIQQ
jgi:hypothetical protein